MFDLLLLIRKGIFDFPKVFKTVNYFREWIDGSFGKVDPDTVEQDIGNFWRGLYKLEKTFAENPNAKMIAEKVTLYF